MKNEVITLVIAGVITVGGISVAYAANSNDFSKPIMVTQNSDNKLSYNYRRTMIGNRNTKVQSNGNYNDMIKTMKDNGFNDEANAMENSDFDAMNKLMTNISAADSKKMVDVMVKNGYGSMGNMMKSVNRKDMIEFHQSMMGK
ncbi:hypothetical protein [Clostridium sp.]